LGVAADHVVTGQADDPLDVVRRAAAQPDVVEQVVEEPDDGVARRRRDRSAGQVAPRPGAAEDDDVTAVDGTEVIDELVDQDPVARQQGVLHRLRRDLVHLEEEDLDEDRDHDGGDQDGQHVASELLPLLLRRALLRCALLRCVCGGSLRRLVRRWPVGCRLVRCRLARRYSLDVRFAGHLAIEVVWHNSVCPMRRVAQRPPGNIASMTDIPMVQVGDGFDLPLVGFGTWQLRGQQAYDAVRWALDAGYRHIDTATTYKNEAEVGRAIRDSGVDRASLFITTKLPPGNVGQEQQTLDDSLRALGTDYVDLWLVHWPPPARHEDSEKIWREFIRLRAEGRCRAIGVSNYSPAEIDELTQATGQTPSVNQVPWSPSRHDPGLLSALRERGMVVEGYSPLRGTRLKDRALREVAKAHGVSPAQVVLRWHVQMGIVVIPKSARRERIASNFDLFGFVLSNDEMERLSKH
jgi:2,5-diketo-D-gluconate reductase A